MTEFAHKLLPLAPLPVARIGLGLLSAALLTGVPSAIFMLVRHFH